MRLRIEDIPTDQIKVSKFNVRKRLDDASIESLAKSIKENGLLLLQDIYDPYHSAITKEIQELLAKFGECLIIDAHSFPAIPLPYENSPEITRP